MGDSAYVFNQRLSLDRPKKPLQNPDNQLDEQAQDDKRNLLALPHSETMEAFMGELPNLSFVQGLAATDSEFEPTFVAILKREFTIDAATYFRHMELSEPRAAAEIVHKLKYALGYLDMNLAFSFAELYEEKLHLGDAGSHVQFTKILAIVNTFLCRYKVD